MLRTKGKLGECGIVNFEHKRLLVIVLQVIKSSKVPRVPVEVTQSLESRKDNFLRHKIGTNGGSVNLLSKSWRKFSVG